MLTRGPQETSIEKVERRLQSEAEAHLDDLLDDALQETFPASDPIAICIDRPSEAIVPDNRTNPDAAAMPLQVSLRAAEPQSTLLNLFGANLWAINRMFDWWLLLLGGRRGK
jgi:hypothetical protein